MAAAGLSAVVVGGSALLGAGVGSAATAELTLVYNCPFPLIGAQDMSVRIVVEDLPDNPAVGEETPATRVTATATVPDLATQGLALVGAATVEGTAKARTTIDNAGSTIDIVPDLVVARTNVPASGPFDTIATGSTPPVTFPNAGRTTITIGDFETTLTPLRADGTETGLGTFTSPCTLNPGQDTLLHEFTVRPSTPTTTTTTTTTTDPTTTTTDPTTTTTEPTTTT
ncbi:5'-nucleotidase, partial [Saccharothrix yanglingensis]|nr:5'-nucleotidase [Saccharothrix yanglingensis]